MKNLSGEKRLDESQIGCGNLVCKNIVINKKVPTITDTYTLSVDEFINGFVLVNTNVSMQVNVPTPVSSWGLKAGDTFFFTWQVICGPSGANLLSYSGQSWISGGSYNGFTANTTKMAKYIFRMTSETTYRASRIIWN